MYAPSFPPASSALGLCLLLLPQFTSAEEPIAPPPEEVVNNLSGAGLLFAESVAWKAAYAKRTTEEGPARLTEFLRAFPTGAHYGEALYWLGYAYQRQKLYPEAMAAWRKALEVCPHGKYADDAAWSLASQCLSNHDYLAAVSAWKSFAEHFPGNPKADDALYNMTRYARYLRDDDQSKAVAQWAYQALAANYPSSDKYPAAMYQVIRNLYLAEDYQACVALAKTFVETQPASDYADEMQYQVVMCLYGAKAYDQALAEIQRLRVEFPGSSYLTTVETYEQTMQNNMMRAARTFDPAAEQERRDAARGKTSRRRRSKRLYTPRMAEMPWLPQEDEIAARDLIDAGISAQNARFWDRAITLYQLVLDNFRGDAYWDDALYKMAGVYELAGDKGRALEVYRRFYTDMVGSTLRDDALNKIAKLLLEQDRELEAYQVYQEMLDQIPCSPYAETALTTLKQHYFDTRDAAGLLRVYDYVLRNLPGHDLWPEAAFQTGCIQMMHREYVKARDAFRLLLDRCPSHDYAVKAQFLLAECHSRRGDVEVAQQMYQKVLDHWPNCGLRDDIEERLARLQKVSEGRGAAGSQSAPRTTPADKEGAARAKPAAKQDDSAVPTEWHTCKNSVLECFPDGLRGLSDPTAPNSRNPLHLLFTAYKSTPLAVNIQWYSVPAGTFAVNLFLNNRVIGTVWPETGEPMIVEIPSWMVKRGRNHLVLYAPMDSAKWDYFALLGDGLSKPQSGTTPEDPKKEEVKPKPDQPQPPVQPMSEEERLAAYLAMLRNPFSPLWEGRRLTVGKKDARSTEFSTANPGNFVQWWVDLDNSSYASSPNKAYATLIESLKTKPESAAQWTETARVALVEGRYNDAAPIYGALAATKTLPPETRKLGRELARVAQEFVKRPAYAAITTEHFHLLAPLETSVLLRQYDIPQLWEAAYAVLAQWVGAVPYGGDRLVVVYDPDYSSYRGGNPIRIGTRYAQDPPQWKPMFSSLAQGYFYSPPVYTALGRNYYFLSALSTFAAWRLPEVLLPRLLPASYAKTIAAAEAKYLTNCDLYIGQVSQGISSRKKLSSTVAPGVLLKLAALRKEPKGEAQGTGWSTWGAFCRLAQEEATPLLGLRDPEEGWAVFEHFAVRFFGEEAKAVLKHCDLEPTEEAREAVKEALAPPKPKPASEKPKPEAGPTKEAGKPA